MNHFFVRNSSPCPSHISKHFIWSLTDKKMLIFFRVSIKKITLSHKYSKKEKFFLISRPEITVFKEIDITEASMHHLIKILFHDILRDTRNRNYAIHRY